MHTQVIDWQGNTLVPDTTTLTDAGNHRNALVDSDGRHFVMAYTKVYSTTDHDVRVEVLSAANGVLYKMRDLFVSLATDKDTAPAICAMTGQYDQHGLAWSHSDGALWSMQAQRYEAVGQGLFVSRATSCALGGGHGVSGSATIGQTFTVSWNFANGFPAIVAGTPTSIPIGPCPGCTLGVDGTIFLGSQLQVTVPANPAFIGYVVSFQGLQLDTTAGSCLGLFRLGDTLDVTVL